MSSAAYPNRGTLPRREELCHLFDKILTVCTETVVDIGGVSDNSLVLKKEELESRYPKLCKVVTKYAAVNKSCEKNIEAIKYSEDVKDELYEYSKNNLAWINVYFSQTFIRKLVRDGKYSFTGFIANIGGLMGLCMGFSLVSVAELIFFCCTKSPRHT